MYVYFLRTRIASLTDRILKVSFRFLAVSGATLEKGRKSNKKRRSSKKIHYSIGGLILLSKLNFSHFPR